MNLFISFPVGGSSTYVNVLGVGGADVDVKEGLKRGNEISLDPVVSDVFLNPVLQHNTTIC